MAEGQLSGKVALVTGAGRGIGSEIAQRLAKDGAMIVAHYAHSKDGAERTVTRIQNGGGRAVSYAADISKRSEVRALFQQIDRYPGRIDIVVNNSGVGAGRPLHAVSDHDVELIFGVNAFGPLYIASEAATRMGEGGRIINLGSTVQEFPVAGSGLYSAAKCALKSLRSSWRRHLVDVASP